MANDTLLFKDCYKDYAYFSTEIPQVRALRNVISVYQYLSSLNGKPQLVSYDTWCPEIFRILSRHYKNSEIAFDNESDFWDLFSETLETHIQNYYVQKSRYNMYLQLSDNELLDLGISVTNVVEHTDDRVDDVFEPLRNISNQTAYKNKRAYADMIRSQISNARMTLLYDFVKKFRFLFISLNCSSEYYG